MKLYEVARVLRSKNAGPYYLTMDIMFDNAADYEKLRASGTVTAEWVANSYRVPVDQVKIIPYPEGHALKITIPRRVPNGNPGDTDVYGAQQVGPLLELDFPQS